MDREVREILTEIDYEACAREVNQENRMFNPGALEYTASELRSWALMKFQDETCSIERVHMTSLIENTIRLAAVSTTIERDKWGKTTMPYLKKRLSEVTEILLPFFPLNSQQVQRAKPEIALRTCPINSGGDFSYDRNKIEFALEEVTQENIYSRVNDEEFGKIVGTWLYSLANPQIFIDEQERIKKVDLVADPDAYLSGGRNLQKLVATYCGFHYCNRTGYISEGVNDALASSHMTEESSRDVNRSELGRSIDSASSDWAKVRAKRIMMAKMVYSRISTDEFRDFVRLPYEQAREKIMSVTGMDLEDISLLDHSP